MKKTFRPGNIGALMDEYERAAQDLRHLVENLSEADFTKVLDPETTDEDCRTAQTIMSHVVSAGYSYADYLRKQFSIDSKRSAKRLVAHADALQSIDEMLVYTAETLDGRWVMSDEEILGSVIVTRWGVTYDIEQLLEHAIVHVLRHRRQIEKLLACQGSL